MSAQRMCPNGACVHHGLVSVFSTADPTMLGKITVETAKDILDRLPGVRAEWVERHREVQAALRIGAMA